MTSTRWPRAAKVFRTVALAELSGAAIYAFSPAVRNQFGSVSRADQRARTEEPQETVPAFVSKYGIPYPIVTRNSPLALVDRVDALPTSVLIDKAGRIARTYVGLVTEVGLSDDIEALLSERAGGAR